MSFPRAAIKRFNEPADSTVPPPGTYDPKFLTDVSVSSSAKVGDRTGRGSGGKARPEGNELFQGGRVSRNSSCTRRRSMTYAEELPDAGNKSERSTSHNKASLSKSRIGRPHSITNSRLTKVTSSSSAGPSIVTSVGPLKALHSSSLTINVKNAELSSSSSEANKEGESFQDETFNVDSPNPTPEITEVYKYGDGIAMNLECESVMVIQEIQDMAQNLQVEISEYKRRLSEEIIRSNELDSKRLELELEVQTLKRDLRKAESAKESWEAQDTSWKAQLEELTSTKLQLEEALSSKLKLEQELHDLQQESEGLKERELSLREDITQLEEDKSLWEGEKREYEDGLRHIQEALKEEVAKREKVEEKCEELKSQLEAAVAASKDKDANTNLSSGPFISEINDIMDSISDTVVYEVKLRELTEQRETLKNELDAMRQELEEGKALIESVESRGSGMDQHQNYIS